MKRRITWIEIIVIIMAIILAAIALAPLAFAQSPPPACAPREQVINELTGKKYNEMPMIELDGTPTGTILHLYGNLETGTWTFVGFPNPVMACIFGTGKRMKVLKPTIPGRTS